MLTEMGNTKWKRRAEEVEGLKKRQGKGVAESEGCMLERAKERKCWSI